MPVSSPRDVAEIVAFRPVIGLGDGEKRWSMGKGGASVFYPLKSNVVLLDGVRKLCRGGSPDIGPTALGITPDSHVTRRTESMTNAGRT